MKTYRVYSVLRGWETHAEPQAGVYVAAWDEANNCQRTFGPFSNRSAAEAKKDFLIAEERLALELAKEELN